MEYRLWLGRPGRTLTLAIVAILLIDITIAVIWFYRSLHPAAQPLVRPVRIQPLRPSPVYIPASATSQVCQLHGEIRTNGVVRVRYGTPVWSAESEAFDRAESASFPNSWSSLHAGCVFEIINGERSAAQAVVSICPRCREAEQRWRRQHGKPS